MQKYWIVITALGSITAIVVFAVLSIMSFNPCSILGLFDDAEGSLGPTTTKALYDGSDLVVIGRITHSYAGCEGAAIWTHMRVTIEESLKNPQNVRILTAKSIGGSIGNYGFGRTDSVIFNQGDRALLFLYKNRPTDTVYRVSPYSSAIDYDFDKKSIRFVDLKVKDETINDITENNTKELTLLLEPFFGYDATTAVTVEGFAYYNSTAVPPLYDISNTNDLEKFGLAITPIQNIMNVHVNGTTETNLQINVSENAVPGLYGFEISAMGVESIGNFLPTESSYAVLLVNVTNTRYESVLDSLAVEIGPSVIARFEPKQLNLTKDIPTDITVNLTYSYQLVADAQLRVVVENILHKDDYIQMSEEENAHPEEIIKKIFQRKRYGPLVPEAFSMSDLILIHDVSVPVELKAGETKTITLKITARADYPDKLLNKRIIVNPVLKLNWEKITVKTNAVEVIVVS